MNLAIDTSVQLIALPAPFAALKKKKLKKLKAKRDCATDVWQCDMIAVDVAFVIIFNFD